MESKKIGTKDLIVAGVFAVLYIMALVFLVSILGVLPILYLMAPLFVGIICGTIYMVYTLKVPKPGAILILSILLGLVLGMSNAWYTLVWSVLLGLIAEIIAAIGKHKSLNLYVVSYSVFACTTCGPFLMLIFAKQSFIAMCAQYYTAEYAAAIDKYTPSWIFLVLIAEGLVGGLIGGLIGKKLLGKHFKKAGIS